MATVTRTRQYRRFEITISNAINSDSLTREFSRPADAAHWASVKADHYNNTRVVIRELVDWTTRRAIVNVPDVRPNPYVPTVYTDVPDPIYRELTLDALRALTA